MDGMETGEVTDLDGADRRVSEMTTGYVSTKRIAIIVTLACPGVYG